MQIKSSSQIRALPFVKAWCFRTVVCFCLGLSGSLHAQFQDAGITNVATELNWNTREQIRLLHEEKLSRTPAQKKMDSQLLYLLRERRQGRVGFGLDSLKPSLRVEPDGRVLVDLRASISPVLLAFIKAHGGLVVNAFRRYSAIRALVPADLTELLAKRADVRFIRPADQATTSATPVNSEEGDIAHRAAAARQFFGADGSGIKVGVLSDSIDNLTNVQATGDLPAVTILSGQEGTGNGEGTAMLEIVHALSPGSPLYFATALNSAASFAQNIRDLQAAGCKVIIDDVTYFNESPFQDGPIAQAIDDVSAAGVLYFSAAGNSGGLDRGTSGTWEGDFQDGGPATIGRGGRLHDFGGVTYNTALPGVGFERVDLSWADPLGQSTNDYDLYVVDSTGSVVRSSTNTQDGNGDPYETIASLKPQDRIVIVKFSGEDRFLHLSTGRGHLTISTPGATFGHNACGASNAFCVAATRVAAPPVPFVGGAANPVEYFSSDGPRHIFFNPDGTAITPGDLSSTGGVVLQKPDFTAADGVFTSAPGFAPFLGTSAAAPHAGALAALLWSYNPFMQPSTVRSVLTGSALTIGNQGFDRNSGAGILMAYQAMAAAPQALLQNVQLLDANTNGELDPNECADLVLTLQNSSGQTITGITAVLSSSTPQVFVDPTPRLFPDLTPGQSNISTVPFHISTSPAFICGSNAIFRLEVTTANLGSFEQPFELNSRLAGLGSTRFLTATNVPIDIPDVGGIDSGVEVSGIVLPLARVRVAAYITHTYDQDLVLSLVAPDHTEVLLSANNGQSGQNYGAGCDAMTYFSDDASNSISTAIAPFVGVFTSEQPLSAFQGKSGSAINGVWTLRVEDTAAEDVGTLQCWSLELTPIGCYDGGGQCLSPPQLTQDVSDQAATNGDMIQFAVVATGTPALFYQWYFNSTNSLPFETNSTLVFTNVNLGQAGLYQVVITNLYGSTTSSPANLSVVVPARIVTDLADQVTTNGDTVAWTVGAQGSPPLYYQWYFNATNLLASGTNGVLVLTNISLAQAGTYQVVVSNDYASVTSAPAHLAVIVIPTIICSSNLVVSGGSWDFNPPTYDDTNLTLQVSETITNALCGQGFAATRQWLVSDTNGYHVTCSQTVQVIDTNAPLLTCPADKSVVYGDPWTFDSPAAMESGALEGIVYNSGTNNPNQGLDPGLIEMGNQITLDGSERYPSQFALQYWGTNATQETFAGSVTARVRFYHNDGPALLTGQAMPGTIFFDSGLLPINATNQGELVLHDFALSAAVPLIGALPSNFTWSVAFSGLGSNDAAGLNLYGPPVVGQVAAGDWALQTNGWVLEDQAGQSLGGELAAMSSGVNLTVLSTVTNALCARSFSATRTWLALDACSNAASCSQTVTVLDHSGPLASGQPQDEVALVGQTVTLTVNVSSCPPVFYQWYFNQTNALPQQTNATLVLTNISMAQAGTYQLAITDDYGSATSAVANVSVMPPPSIVTNPPDQMATNGDLVQITVVAQGAGTLAYQWFFDSSGPLPQGTNATLVLSNVAPAQAGNYSVIVADAFGSVTSSPAHLKVLVVPVSVGTLVTKDIPALGSLDSEATVEGLDAPIALVEVGAYISTTNDADLVISLLSPDGTEVLLSANNGQSGENYGTNCDGTTWFSDLGSNSITSGTAPFLGVFQPQTPLSAFIGKSGTNANGVWALRVGDTGQQTTATLQCWYLRLTLEGCPAGGGACLNPPQLVQNISDQTTTNGATFQWSVLAEGSQPLSYQWYFDATNALSQATNASLELTNVSLAYSGLYQVVVANLYGSLTGAPAHLTVVLPATILSSPSDQVATNGDTVSWSVVAQGTAPLFYQWYFNLTNPLPAQTNSILLLTNVTPEQAGTYDVNVSNAYASVMSAPANLVVRVLPRIVCSQDTTAILGSVWDFTPPGYTDTNLILQILETTTNALCGESFSATRRWLVSDTNDYRVTCSQTVSVLDTNAPVMNCPIDKTVAFGNVWSFDVPTAQDPRALQGLVYDNLTNSLNQALDSGQAEVGNQIRLDGSERYPGQFIIGYWGTNATQDAFSGTVTARVRFYQNDGSPLSTGEMVPGTVFYDSGSLAVTATNQGALLIQDFELSAAVPLTGVLPSNFTWTVVFSGLGSNDAAGLNLNGSPDVGGVAAGYWVFGTNGWSLEGQAGDSFGAQLTALSSGVRLSVLNTVTNALCAQSFTATRTWLAVDACSNAASCSQTVTVQDQSGPLVLSQPQDQAVLAGQTVKLTVAVASCPPVFYQWYFNQTNALAQETNATLVLTNINTAEAGSYQVAITNDYGSVTSVLATVNVEVPAVIVGNPVDQIATNGDDVHWRVLTKGSAPLFYQWYFNVTNALVQQTNAILDLTNVSPVNAGSYQVVVANSYGSATSAPAILSIVVPPALLTNLTDQTATNGDIVTWMVAAQGTAPLSYQWYFNSTILSLETNATLILSNVVAAQAGIYQAAVVNAYGSVTSSPANLTIVVIPHIRCSPDISVSLGSPWDFIPPTYNDTNLVLQLLDTTTNTLCGAGFSATRRWLVSDTNGYQVTCSQTVNVLDATVPIMSCPSDKTVAYGADWSFDLPAARDPRAIEALVYSDGTNNLNQTFDPGPTEVGNQLALDGTERYPSQFSVVYWGTNATQATFEGTVTARVRFYRNDGPALSTPALVIGIDAPGTVFYDSGPLPITATNQGAIVIQDFGLSAAVPIINPLPSGFTWTVAFSGLGSNDAAGLSLYGPPVVGSAATNYWAMSTNGWTLQDASGASFGAQLAALSSGVSLSVFGTSTNSLCARSFSVTRTWQAVDSCSNAASCSQTVTVQDPSGLFVVTQPQDKAVLLGQSINLSVGVSSCSPVAYQWYFNQTNALADATNSLLLLTNITIDQLGSYQVVITNGYGSITSAPANLSMAAAPKILSQPQDLVVDAGSVAVFTVSANGSPVPTYYWFHDRTNAISGANGPSLILTNVRDSQAGFYSVLVSNLAGTVLSTNAQLKVTDLPAITSEPQSDTVQQGADVVFTVTATGTGPLSYQWMANCSRPISGATAPTLRLKSVGPLDSGSYCVAISNLFGLTNSQPAILRVLVKPRLTAFAQAQNGVSLTFATVTNLLYTVYYSDLVPATNWVLLPSYFQQPGTGGPLLVHDPAASGRQRFYKVVAQ